MRVLLSRLVALFGGKRLDTRLDEEVRAHLNLLADDYIRRGMAPDEARLAARRAFGEVEPMKETYRDHRGLRWLDDLQRDLAYALRSLRRTPGFTAVAVLSLGLGIGANAAIFGMVDAVLLRPLPVAGPDQLVVFAARQPGQATGANRAFSYELFEAFRESATLADVAASAPLRMSVDADGIEEPTVSGQLVSGNYYAMLGVGAAVGRLMVPDDEREGGQAVAVLSHAYFQQRFGGDASIVGRSLRLNGQPFIVVGVSAPGFSGTRPGTPADITVPLMTQQRVMPQVDDAWISDPYQFWLELVGRLNSRVPESQALATLNMIYKSRLDELRRAGRVGPPGLALEFERGAQGTSDVRSRYSGPLAVLMGIVVLVLIAACANVANLLLARALRRRREIALRMSLGARRLRIGRQLLTESAVIALAGGCIGLALAASTTGLLRALLDGEPLQHVVAGPDGRALLLTVVVSLLTAVLFGLAPLILVSHVDPQRALQDRAERVAGRRLFGQGLLVSTQVAVSLVLLVGAGLFVRTLANLRTTDLGFDQAQVLVLRLEPEGSNQKRGPDGSFNISLMRTYHELLDRIEGLPGVRSASLAGMTPLADDNALVPRVRRPGTVARPDDLQIRMIQAYPGYFSTAGIGVLAGRDLSELENQPAAAAAGVLAAVINETMARRVFGDVSGAVGQRFMTGGGERVFEIVGVVEDVRDLGPREEVLPVAYATYTQAPTGRAQMTLFVRTTGDPRALVSDVRGLARSIDPSMPLPEVQSLAQRVAGSINQERIVALLASLFGGVALLLAAIGLFGVTAYAVTCREREFGLRMALGATRRAIVATVMRDSFRLVSLGGAAGLAGALAGSRLVANRLFGVSPADPATIVGATLILIAVAVVATLVPARRASRVEPWSAVRSE